MNEAMAEAAMTSDALPPVGLTRMSIQREKASPELFQELAPLLVKHYLEIAHFQDIELNPDYSMYLKMEELGALRVFTARLPGRALVGYAVYFVRHNLHYRTSLQATQDILFVDPSHRGAGARLIRIADEALAAEGVQVVYHHVKLAHNFGPLLKRMGYEEVEHVWARRLD